MLQQVKLLVLLQLQMVGQGQQLLLVQELIWVL
jgi:hypothetical protein